MKKQLLEKYVNRLSVKAFLSLTLFLFPGFIYSQTLTEELGGITTNFNIISISDTLEVVEQIVILRGLSDSYTGHSSYSDGAYGYGYGYGLQTYRLEFTSRDELSEIKGRFGIRYKYGIEFFDADDTKLMETELGRGEIVSFKNGDNLKIYSINLQKIPLIVLNKTKTLKIRITE